MNWKWIRVFVCAICTTIATCNSQEHSGTVPELPEDLTAAPPFSVTVELAPRAADELKRRGETIVVAAYFYGLANSRGDKYKDPMGQIYWSESDRLELDGPGVAKFLSRKINLTLLDYFLDRKPIVLINVASGRRTDKSNLLDCGTFEDSVHVAAKSGIVITCNLIR